jgi:hypothetical protein
MGMFTQPTCEGQLKPPSCNLDAECETACSGQGTITATCTPPKVTILVSSDPTLKTTLAAHMPDVIAVAAQGALVAKAAADVSTTAQNVITEVGNSIGCAAIFGAEEITKIQGSVSASLSISVSVMGSASVIAAVGG